MAVSKKSLHEQIRNEYMEVVKQFLIDRNEEVLKTGSNEFALPCIDSEGNDEFIVLTFKVPTGSRDGEPYDGYSMQEEYQLKQVEKIEKAKVDAEKKIKKIARDKKEREAKAKAKQERESVKG